MSDDDFKAVLREVTGEILEHIPHCLKWVLFGYEGEPTTYDINHGHCGVFADTVASRVPEARKWDCYWDDHAAIFWRGRYYDAECHYGVEDPKDLPFFANKGRSRKEVLLERRFVMGDNPEANHG